MRNVDVRQAMFRGGFSGGKTREEFVEAVADVYIGKVSLITNTGLQTNNLCCDHLYKYVNLLKP